MSFEECLERLVNVESFTAKISHGILGFQPQQNSCLEHSITYDLIFHIKVRSKK